MDHVTGLMLTYRYAILVPIGFIEGPISSFIVGTLVASGFLQAVPAYLLYVASDIFPDAILYGLGRYGKNLAFVKRMLAEHDGAADSIERLRRLWFDHTLATMTVSKLAYGFAPPMLVSAGFVNLPPRRYFPCALLITLLQYALFITLGYYFSSAFTLISRSLIGVQTLAAIVILFAIVYSFSARAKRRLGFSREQKEARKK